MGAIAKGEITLSPVNDAYTVLLTPATCTIRADFDGSHPNLENATTSIVVKRGTKEVNFKIVAPHISASGIQFTYVKQPDKSVRVGITKIPSSILNGWVSFDIETEDGFHYTTNVQFNFSVVRESTMLDWIQDWEGSKTKVGGTYIMTPKLFVGKKEEVITIVDGAPIWMPGALTGVYIGPDLLKSGENSAGIYGYLKDKEIFHINGDGGFIGGWTFNEAGLQSNNGVVNILSEGTIYAQNPKSTTPYWGIYADGHATFANGNVKFMSDGSAEFAGKIISQLGSIGGWKITTNQIHSKRIIFDSAEGFIGINATTLQVINAITGDLTFPETPDGGIKMWYNSATNFGLAAWATGEKTFQLGSSNMIAGWLFNHKAIWTGETSPSLTQGGYTAENTLTMAPNGIRSHKWYIDANGTASFVGGFVKFNTENAEMFGWLMRDGRFSARHAALVSSDYYCGLYVSPADLSEVGSASLIQTINNHGGIYLYSDGANSIMRAYDKKGNLGFFLSTSGYNTIGKWNFNHESIYTGSQNLDDRGFTRDNNSIVLGINGLIGQMWKLMADGSGAVAGGNIAWDKNGKVTFSNQVTLAWSSITGGPNLTKIDKDGIYTGTISADKITAGAISTADIICDGKWALMRDGTGYLAAHNISWNADGTLTVKGHIEADSGSIGSGGHKFNITSSGIAYGDISNWNKSDLSQKMLLNPASFRLQYSDPSNSSQACKIYLGKESWPSRASSFPYGTIAWIYKKDLANLEMEGSRCSEPAIRIETETIYGSGVAISSNGAIIANGVISEKGYLLMASTSMVSMMHFNPFNGSTFIIKNTTGQECFVQLPNEGTVRFVLDLAVNEPFIYRIKAFCLPGNNVVSIGLDNNTAIKCYVNGKEQAASTKYQLVANHLYEFTLIYDGNHHTIWHLKDIT